MRKPPSRDGPSATAFQSGVSLPKDPGMDPQPLDRKALGAAVFTFTIWGLFPFLFQAMGRAGAEPFEMTAWRAVAAVPCCLLLVASTRQGRAFLTVVRNPRLLGALALSGALIGVNWTTYVWAVEEGHTLAASLGYFINPLLNMVVGALVFRERMDAFGKTAVALAVAGVALQTWAAGEPPWIALILAFCLGGYGVVRKKAVVEAQTGLLVECLVLVVPAVVYLIWLAGQGGVAFGDTVEVSILLLLGGPATVIPLVTFAYAARRIPLTAVGFIQFITPTCLFVIGWIQGEPLNAPRLASFAFIWAGVALFAWGAVRNNRRPARGKISP
jgi:chloramphenicol-sensitive protein RarD